MKLKFKQQAYQNDAAMAVVRCFEGQGKGFRKEVVSRYEAPDVLRSKGTGQIEQQYSPIGSLS